MFHLLMQSPSRSVCYCRTAALLYCLVNFLVLLPPSFQALDDIHAHRLLLQGGGDSTTSDVIITEGPVDGASINFSSFMVHFEVRSGIDAGMRCWIGYQDNVFRDWESCVSPYPIHLQNDGEYEFQVMADQGLGTELNPLDRRTWKLDRVAPVTTIEPPYPPNTAATSARIFFSGQDDRSSITGYECRLNTAQWTACTSPHSISNLRVGFHLFRVRAFDSAGNVDPQPASRSWRVLASSESTDRTTLPDVEETGAEFSADGLDPDGEAQSETESNDDGSVVGRTRSNWLITLLLLVFVLIGIFFVCLACFKCWTRMRHRGPNRNEDGGGSQLTSLESEVLSGSVHVSDFSSMMASLPDNIRRFRYEELRTATGGFPENGILGEGGFGKVFSGSLEDGRPVAVKKLEHSGQQGDREFFVEVTTLSRARHLNILNLLGVCVEAGNRACVFELMDWGSARSLLDEGDPRFTWEARLKVGLGVARGLACLHESVDPPIVHRDLKSENVLMDRNGESRISDFGLCTVSHHEARQRHLRRHAVTVGTIRGTFGYLAPEVIGSGRVSTKSDVYAFGVFLLELLTGRRPIETQRSSQEQDLVKWALRHVDNVDTVVENVDPVISSKVSFVQITAFVELAASCLNFSPTNRPTASDAAFRLGELMNFRENSVTSIKAKTKKGANTKIDDFRLASRLSEMSETIPTGMPPQSFLSEGEITPPASRSAIASTSSRRITEIQIFERRFQDSSPEQLSGRESQLSLTNRDRWDDAGPSTPGDTASP